MFGIVMVFLLFWGWWTIKRMNIANRKANEWRDFKRKYVRRCPWCDGSGLDFTFKEWEEHFFLPYAVRWEQTANIWLGYRGTG